MLTNLLDVPSLFLILPSDFSKLLLVVLTLARLVLCLALESRDFLVEGFVLTGCRRRSLICWLFALIIARNGVWCSRLNGIFRLRLRRRRLFDNCRL
jgi:hypothetical protein